MYGQARCSLIVIFLLLVSSPLGHAQEMLAPGLPKQAFSDVDIGLNAVSSKLFCSYEKDTRICSVVININGEIKPATLDAFERAIAHAVEIRPSGGWSVEINSPGGHVDAAMALGRLLRKLEATISIKRESACASSCVFVLVGAVHRSIHGRVGIHRPYFETPTQAVTREAVTLAYQRNLQRLHQYLREMNISEGLADRMIAIPPEKIEYLSKRDIEGYRVLEFDPIWKETIDLQEAQKYGLTRPDYARRRAHAQQNCTDYSCYDRIMKKGQ